MLGRATLTRFAILSLAGIAVCTRAAGREIKPARGHVRPAGPLTVRQIWAFYPYENSLVTVRATGRQVRVALERAADCIARLEELGRNCDTLEGAEYYQWTSRRWGLEVRSSEWIPSDTGPGRDAGPTTRGSCDWRPFAGRDPAPTRSRRT